MHRRCTLIGCRGSGKSTLGQLLAQRLRWSFVDADARLENEAGTTIADLFARDGVDAFRDREQRTLSAILAEHDPFILATGGGVVLRAENRAALRAHGGLVVYIEVDAPALQARLRANAGGRPSLTGGAVADEIPKLLAERDALYREIADLIIDGTRPASELSDQIVAILAA
jgi:shikimate kinase